MRQELVQRGRSGDSASRIPHSAFTLVELLVVIAIIGLLAGLLLVAARQAIAAGKRAQIVAENTQIATALEDYKNSVGSYPPNAQTDDSSVTGSSGPLNEADVLANFKRHFLKAFPNHREPNQLIEALVGLSSTAVANPQTQTAVDPNEATNLPGGMNAAEALVFWIGGFSDDPKYPISGPGGPAYSIDGLGTPSQGDPIDGRSWALDINIAQLGPRDPISNYFPETHPRVIDYYNPRTKKVSRINFWYFKAPNSEVPYVYFDASRGSGVSASNDAPGAPQVDGADVSYGSDQALPRLANVYAIKTARANVVVDPNAKVFDFANSGKFQVLHSGIDGFWGVFPRVDPNDPTQLIPTRLLFPDGPWTGDLADTLASFSNGALEDSQP